MKKLFLFLILFVSVLLLKAGVEPVSYVTFDGKTYFCEKVTTGLFNMNIRLSDGSTMKVPIKKVQCYSTNGRMFERLPVMCQNAPENCTALMEYVTSRNGFRLYKYNVVQEHGELYNSTYEKAHMELGFFVFKDGKFHLEVTQKNAESVLPFFGIEVLWN